MTCPELNGEEKKGFDAGSGTFMAYKVETQKPGGQNGDGAANMCRRAGAG